MAQLALLDSEEVLAQRREAQTLRSLIGTPGKIDRAGEIREYALGALKQRQRDLQTRMGVLKDRRELENAMKVGREMIRTIEGIERLKQQRDSDWWLVREGWLPSEFLEAVIN